MVNNGLGFHKMLGTFRVPELVLADWLIGWFPLVRIGLHFLALCGGCSVIDTSNADETLQQYSVEFLTEFMVIK
jgi:hypothetical protein